MAGITRTDRQDMHALRAVVACAVALLGMLGEARAQSAICRQIAAELAALPTGDGGRAGSRQANQARARLGRVQAQMASLGCNRGFVLFGAPPPAECAGLRAEAASLQGSLSQLGAETDQGGSSRRRMQLMASYDANNCRSAERVAPPRAPSVQVDPQPRRSGPGGFLEALFGSRPEAPRYATPEDRGLLPDPPAQNADDEDDSSLGGNLPICVRTCDGFFFPVNYRGVDDQHEDVCRASCPGADTRVYFMRAGADLDTAHTRDGQPYTALPQAFSYRKSFDAACSCKSPQQTWGSVLQKAEAMIRERGTITVTEESSLRMSRPTLPQGLRGVKDPEEKSGSEPKAADARRKAAKPAEAIVADPTAEPTAAPPQKTIRVVAPDSRPRPKAPHNAGLPPAQ